MQAFSSCSEWELFFVVVSGLLIAVASLVAEQGSRCVGFSSCGMRAHYLWCRALVAQQHVGCSRTRDRTHARALAGGFLTTAPPRKSPLIYFWWECKMVQLLWKTVWQFLKKLKHRITIWPNNPTPKYILKRIESRESNKILIREFSFSFWQWHLLIDWLLCWVFVSVLGLPVVAASGGHSSSQCTGLSLSRPLLLRSTGSRRAGSVVVAHGPSCSVACGIFPDQGANPCPLH